MVGESGRSHTGTVHRYYKCSHAKRKKGCDKKPVKKDWIEDAVIHYIMKIVMNDELVDHIADAILNILAQENSKLPQLNARLKEIESGIQNMLNAIQQGILTPSTKERLEALEQEKEELKVAIYSEELQKPKITKEHIAFWISKFRDTDLTEIASRKRLVESFVNAVFVYDDKVVFTFNYKDGSKTATIDEITAELGSDLDGTTPPAKRAGVYLPFLLVEMMQRLEPAARSAGCSRERSEAPPTRRGKAPWRTARCACRLARSACRSSFPKISLRCDFRESCYNSPPSGEILRASVSANKLFCRVRNSSLFYTRSLRSLRSVGMTRTIFQIILNSTFYILHFT